MAKKMKHDTETVVYTGVIGITKYGVQSLWSTSGGQRYLVMRLIMIMARLDKSMLAKSL